MDEWRIECIVNDIDKIFFEKCYIKLPKNVWIVKETCSWDTFNECTCYGFFEAGISFEWFYLHCTNEIESPIFVWYLCCYLYLISVKYKWMTINDLISGVNSIKQCAKLYSMDAVNHFKHSTAAFEFENRFHCAHIWRVISL